MSATHSILVMTVGDDGHPDGNLGELPFRFVPRIGEHVLVDRKDDPSEIFEVVDVHYADDGMMEIWVYNLGDHIEYDVKARLPQRRPDALQA